MHVIKESHIDDLCPECKQPHGGGWRDEWHGEVHYQVATCQNCGFDDIFKKTDLLTSGKF